MKTQVCCACGRRARRWQKKSVAPRPQSPSTCSKQRSSMRAHTLSRHRASAKHSLYTSASRVKHRPGCCSEQLKRCSISASAAAVSAGRQNREARRRRRRDCAQDCSCLLYTSDAADDM
eukprot:14702324-Alexandrium_andersonii.AAC.1